MLTGGISVFSLVQLLLSGMRILIPLNNNTGSKAIPTLRSRNLFHILSDKLYHLKKDCADFIRMSSIHGVRNFTESFRENVFWFSVISVATAIWVHFVRDLFEGSPLTEVGVELDHKMWSVDEVFTISC